MNRICTIVYGSHLYGTATPQSDRDYRGIFVPSERDIWLGRIPRTYTPPQIDWVDEQWLSLHYFVQLAARGQTMPIEMLFAPPSAVLLKRPDLAWIYHSLVENRKMFLSKNIKAFVGYARKQASKYSLKGDRLNKLNAFINVLENIPLTSLDIHIGMVWDQIPRDSERTNANGIRELQICGKWYGETTSISNVLESVNRIKQRFGERAQAAAEGNGADWKALSHAVRVTMEVADLLETGKIVYPLAYASELMEIRTGQLTLARVQDRIDYELARVETLLAASTWPENVNQEKIDDLLLSLL